MQTFNNYEYLSLGVDLFDEISLCPNFQQV